MFSVVLVMVQMGLYVGFGRMVTTMIERADTDLWVMRQGTKCFEDPSLLVVPMDAVPPDSDQVDVDLFFGVVVGD